MANASLPGLDAFLETVGNVATSQQRRGWQNKLDAARQELDRLTPLLQQQQQQQQDEQD